MMFDINKIEDWKKNLGMLPINLFYRTDAKYNNYILLNGGSGDFCLDLNSKDIDIESLYSMSWSSNTKNYVIVDSKEVKVFNWKERKIESINKSFVSENYLKFYDYLQTKSYRTEFDITPFILNIYRKLRNLANENITGKDSLNLLLYLLAVYEEKQSIREINKEKWGLSPLQSDISDSEFGRYLEEFSGGILGSIKPNLELIIRHSSGVIFQESHKEALFFDKNIDLFTGTLSDNYLSRKLLYSSVHYTPPYIARIIVENSLRNIDIHAKDNLKIFDPACGTSEFLLEVLKQLQTMGYKGSVEISGWDSSEIAITTSSFILNYEKRLWKDKLKISLELVDDSLARDWKKEYDLILMNPPFISWEQLSSGQREVLRENLQDIMEKKPNLASAFMYKGVNSLNTGGIIGTVIPSSILTYESYKKLRDHLNNNIESLLIGKFGNYVFENALTDVSIYIGKNNSTKETPLLIWTRNEKGIVSEAIRGLRKYIYLNAPTINENNYSIYRPSFFPFNKYDWNLLSHKENELHKKLNSYVLAGKLKRSKDIFQIKQGIRSGHNRVFKLSIKQYRSLPSNEKKYFRLVVENSTIKNGRLLQTCYIWYPYDNNGLIFEKEKDLKRYVPNYYSQVLLLHKKELSTRARKSERDWWTLSEHRAWLEDKYPKLISTEFGNSGSYAFDYKGEFVIQGGFGIIPKKEFESDEYYYFYLAIFNSPFFNTLLSIYSKQLAGGNWWNLSSHFTQHIPLPIITKELISTVAYQKLVFLGKKIAKEGITENSIIDEFLLGTIYP